MYDIETAKVTDQSIFLNCVFTGSLPDGQSWSSWVENSLPIGFYEGLEISFRNGHIYIVGGVK